MRRFFYGSFLVVLACGRSTPSPDADANARTDAAEPPSIDGVARECSIECLPSQTCCGGVCVDPRSNPDNCGRCGQSCGEVFGGQRATFCEEGACVTAATCRRGTRAVRHGNFEGACCPETDKCSCAPGCPISRRSAKRNIVYLSREDEDDMLAALGSMHLARYDYRAPLDDGRRHLGYILDDAPDLPSSAGDHVDVYAYASMTVAALKAQQREIEDLKARVAALERSSR